MLSSPAFVLEEARLHANLARLAELQQASGVELLFALKGFALPAVMPQILSVARAIAASSLNEAQFGYAYSARPVHLYAPAYRPADIPQLIALASHWTFNSLSAYERWIGQLPEHIEVGLRVNPHYGFAGAPLYNPGRPGARLGVPPSAAQRALPPRISGLHVHTLCEADADAFSTLVEHLIIHFEPWLRSVRWLNLGGGHLVTRAGYDTHRFVETIQQLRSALPNLEVIYLEPSAAFVWEAGYLVAEVLDIAHTEGRQWAMLDVSFTAHMPDTLEMPYKPIVREALPEPNPAYPTYWLGGITCLAGDEMGPYSFPEPLVVGQRLTFHDMAHYTFVKTTLFNGVAHPALVVQGEKGFRIVKTFGYEDYVRRLQNG